MAQPRKFDAPNLEVSQAGRRVYEAFPGEAARRALQGVANRVLGDTGGTAGTTNALIADGSTGGVKITNAVRVLINGQESTCVAQDNLEMPAGTLEANSVCKYLVSTGTGTSGTVTGPGNIVDKADYDSATEAAAACKLPDLPDGHCALGILTLNCPADVDVVMNAAALGTTQGTSGYTQLWCMPYDG